MWKNFCVMPLMMKFMIMQAAIFGIGAILGFLPIWNYSIAGQSVPYIEWWLSSAGVQFIVIALSLSYSAFNLLKRNQIGRVFYLATLISVLLFNLLYSVSQPSEIAWGGGYLLFLVGLYWYLFKKESVVAYFESKAL